MFPDFACYVRHNSLLQHDAQIKLLEKSRERLCGKTVILLSGELFGGAAQDLAPLTPQSSAEATFALEKSQDLWDSSMSNRAF